MNIKIFLIEILLISKIFCDDDCPTNCVICDETKKKCTKCENGYVFYSPAQNEINCILLSVASRGYFKSESGIYYSCTNDAYGYRRNNEDECFKKDVLAIKNYYSYDDKHYYPCDEDYDIVDTTIEGIDYCNRCELDKESKTITCLNCKYGYAFKNKNYLECLSKEDLSQDRTLYKYDDNNYLSCVLDNCLYCSSRTICIQCIDDYYLKNSKRDKCFPLSEIDPINEFYLDGNVYYSCYLNDGVSHCKECSSQTQCTKCDDGYTILDDDDTKCEKISELNSIQNLYYTHNGGLNYYSCVKHDYDNKHCLRCDFDDVDDYKCLLCDDNYFFQEGQGDNCIEGTSITNNYYKKNETFYDLCSNAIDNCETCENDKKCLTCSSDYGILDDNYTICQEITSLYGDNYIYQDNNLYYTCELKINGCKKCTDENTCIETLNYEYCILEDNSVYQLNLSSDIYYHSPLTPRNDYCIECDNNFDLCSLCLINSNSDFECIECELGFSLIDKTECDYSATYAINEEYFSDDNYINFYKCDNKALSSNAIDHCLKCEFDTESNSNNCNECNTGYIILDDNLNMCIYKGQTIIDQITNKKLVANELETKYVGIISIRKLLCENEPPIEIIYDNNIIYGIIELLNEKYSVEFKYQALWCLINITYWNKKGSRIIRKAGGIDKIISLLNNNIDEIKEMALWCLENMLPDSLKIQNYLVNKKVINILMTLLSTNNNKKIISHCVSIIKVLIKPYYKKKKDTADINKLINIISKLIMEIKYFPEDNIIKYIYQDSCFLLSYISEHFKDYKETFLENGIIQYIIELIKNPIIENDEYIFLTLLKIIGNVINGNVNQTQQILNYDILPILKKYITNNNKIIQKEICWIISNIVADTEESMIKVIDNGFFPLLLQIFENNDAETRKDVIFALFIKSHL